MSEKTIHIRLLTSVAGTEYTYSAGQEVDAPEHIAVDLIQAGHAVPTNTEKRENATAKPPKKEQR